MTPSNFTLAELSAIVAAEAGAILDAMPPIDMLDYLLDYTAARDRRLTDAETEPAAMRAAILADIAMTGPDLFILRATRHSDEDLNDLDDEDLENWAEEMASKRHRRIAEHAAV